MKGIFAKVLIIGLSLCILAASVAFCDDEPAPFKPSVEVHAFMQNRMYMNPGSSSRFALERVSLSTIGHITPKINGYVEVYYQPWVTDFSGLPTNNTTLPGLQTVSADQGRVYLESAYVDLPLGNDGSSNLRIGKGRQLNFGMTETYPNRKTSQYGILAETFTQDRIQGLQYSYKKNEFDGGASFFTDPRFEFRLIGDFATTDVFGIPTVAHFAERDDSAENSGEMAGSIRAGISTPSFKAHLSAEVGRLNSIDANWIAFAYKPFATTTDTTHHQFGFDGSYSHGPFVLQAEAYTGQFSFLTITGYSALLGYQPAGKLARRYYARWDALNNNQTPVAYNPVPIELETFNLAQCTWNTQQLTFGVVQPISKGVWAEMEYELNMEAPPAGATLPANNNLFFVEFFTGF